MKKTNSKKVKLQKIYQTLLQYHTQTQKIAIEHLLVRYYVSNDKAALQEMYHFPNNAGLLKKILVEGSNGIRTLLCYFAAQALYELKTISAYEILTSCATSSDFAVRLYAQLALESITAVNKELFNEARNPKYGHLLKVLCIQHIPSSEDRLLQLFLRDRVLMVRVCAARKLWEKQDESGGKELRSSLST